MPIPVLRLITRLNVGGPSIHAVALSSGLAAYGFETQLAFGRVGESEGDMRYLLDAASPRPQATEVASLQRPVSPVADAAAFRRVYRLMCDVKPAIVHTHMAKAGAVGRLAAHAYNLTAGRHAPARIVHTYHGHVLEGYFSPAKTRLFVGAERALARITDRIVTVSPRIREDIEARYRIGRAEQHRVVRLGFNLDRFASIGNDDRARARRALEIPDASDVVTSVGRLTAVKNHQLFLETAALVARRRPSAIFLIAGDGELRRELEQAVAALGLADRVRFLGWRRDLDTIYAATGVFLLTSRNEGTPVAVIESMAAGCAAVATGVGGVRDVIETPAMGRVADSDPSALADAVAALLDDPVERQRVGEHGRAHVTAQFTLTRLLENVAFLYAELLGDRRFRA